MPFEKGQSGNPHGRPKGALNKVTADIRALAEPFGRSALAHIVRTMRSAENEATRLAAAQEILNRAYGKSTQPIEHSGHLDVAMTLDRVITEMREREMSMRSLPQVEDALRH